MSTEIPSEIMESCDKVLDNFTEEEINNLFDRASKGDKIAQELSTTLFNRNFMPLVEWVYEELSNEGFIFNEEKN